MLQSEWEHNPSTGSWALYLRIDAETWLLVWRGALPERP